MNLGISVYKHLLQCIIFLYFKPWINGEHKKLAKSFFLTSVLKWCLTEGKYLKNGVLWKLSVLKVVSYRRLVS